MIRLDATTKKLQAVLAGAVTANQLACAVFYSDHSASAYDGGSQMTLTSDTTQVDICAAPGASTVRDIDFVSIRNRDTATATVTVMIDISTVDTELVKVILAVGDTLQYIHGHGWSVIETAGSLKSSGGGGGDALTTDPLSQFAATTSAQLAGVISDETGTGALVFATSPTLVTPALGTPASGVLTNCTGLTEAGQTLADNTTGNVSSTAHGYAPKSPADATKFLNGDTAPAYALVKDSDLSTSDITTNNVGITKHGFAPKLPNDATKYLDGTGAYTVPAGGGGGSGDVVGPASSTDNALARFDTTTGKLLQNGVITQDDTGALTFPDDVRQSFNPGATKAGLNVGGQSDDPSIPADGDIWYKTNVGYRVSVSGVVSTLPTSSGKILQVVSTTKTDVFTSTTEVAWTDITGLSVTITPSSSSNKVLVRAVTNATMSLTTGQIRLVRGSTAIGVGDAAGSRVQAGASIRDPDVYMIRNSSIEFLDSPATISATTYKVQFFIQTGGDTLYVNRSSNDTDADYSGRVASTITVMEVAS